MPRRVFALLITLFVLILPLSVHSATQDELQSLYDTAANHIFKNEELISSLITDEEDALCAAAIAAARDILLSGGATGEELEFSYKALYSAYSLLTLIEQRGSELTSEGRLNLFATLSKIVLTEDYYSLIDENTAEKIRNEAESAISSINDRQNIQPLDFSAKIQGFYNILYDAAATVLKTYSGYFVTAGFYDVGKNDWFCEAVEFVFENGLFKGTSDNYFSPDVTMTRGMFITVLSRLSKADTSGYEASYGDVDENAYYAAPVYWARANGILTWADADEFMPEKPVTREEMVVSMYNLCLIKNEEAILFDSSQAEGIADLSDAQESAAEPIKWAFAKGVITGYGEGLIKPRATATRAEVAQVFVNFAKLLAM